MKGSFWCVATQLYPTLWVWFPRRDACFGRRACACLGSTCSQELGYFVACLPILGNQVFVRAFEAHHGFAGAGGAAANGALAVDGAGAAPRQSGDEQHEAQVLHRRGWAGAHLCDQRLPCLSAQVAERGDDPSRKEQFQVVVQCPSPQKHNTPGCPGRPGEAVGAADGPAAPGKAARFLLLLRLFLLRLACGLCLGARLGGLAFGFFGLAAGFFFPLVV